MEFLIFYFVGSELAESALGVADLPAWDNIECRECNFLSFGGIFRLSLCLSIGIFNVYFVGSEMAEFAMVVADLPALRQK